MTVCRITWKIIRTVITVNYIMHAYNGVLNSIIRAGFYNFRLSLYSVFL